MAIADQLKNLFSRKAPEADLPDGLSLQDAPDQPEALRAAQADAEARRADLSSPPTGFAESRLASDADLAALTEAELLDVPLLGKKLRPHTSVCLGSCWGPPC